MMPAACLQPQSFQFDPAKLRPQRLRETIREVAKQYEEECRIEEQRMGRPAFRRLFVTLTYAENSKGDPGDVSECLRHVRQWARRLGCEVRYEWVAEVQKRGALHYHLLIWLPRRLLLPKLDRRGWWPHGMTQVQTARNPVGYLCKYASKCRPEDLRRLRKGTRLYGHGGGWPAWRETLRAKLRQRWIRRKLQWRADDVFLYEVEREAAESEREMAALFDLELPAWVERFERQRPPPELVGRYTDSESEFLAWQVDQWERQDRRDALLRKGRALLARCTGGYVDRVTGEFFPTPYKVTVERGIVTVQRKEGQRGNTSDAVLPAG